MPFVSTELIIPAIPAYEDGRHSVGTSLNRDDALLLTVSMRVWEITWGLMLANWLARLASFSCRLSLYRKSTSLSSDWSNYSPEIWDVSSFGILLEMYRDCESSFWTVKGSRDAASGLPQDCFGGWPSVSSSRKDTARRVYARRDYAGLSQVRSTCALMLFVAPMSQNLGPTGLSSCNNRRVSHVIPANQKLALESSFWYATRVPYNMLLATKRLFTTAKGRIFTSIIQVSLIPLFACHNSKSINEWLFHLWTFPFKTQGRKMVDLDWLWLHHTRWVLCYAMLC